MPDPNDSFGSSSNSDPGSIPGATPIGGVGGAMAPVGSLFPAALPSGLFTSAQALEADSSGEFADLAPTFGDVLLSVGTGVAASQEALDRGVVSTARTLGNTNVTVVTEVVQELDDNGLPDATKTTLIQETVSLINFVAPTVHEWSHVALSMDLSVGSIDNESGFTFNRSQSKSRLAGVGLFWGFVGFGLHSDSSSSTFGSRSTDQEADWSRGQVRLDALLRPRPVRNFNPPAEVVIGPQIYFAQGALSETESEGVVTERSLTMTITVRKASGAANPNVVLQLDAGPFIPSFIDDATFNGNTTNAAGQIRVELRRQIPNPRFQRPLTATITATLGALKSSTQVSL